MKKRLIETTFPLVQLNPLSKRERNSFRPIYKMHKWFARRSSTIFRAILLGAAYPAPEDGKEPMDLMEAFYQGHADDPLLRGTDGEPLKVLDPFMGGGTTVVEALRLGFDVTGVDSNPIAWFIVKGETTPVNLEQLDAAFQRVADKVKEPLLDLYRTQCPLTGEAADIIYGFWVKQAVCVDPDCKGLTDLFKSYIVGRIQGDLGVRTMEDVSCPFCEEVFDWEVELCTITCGGPQVLGGAPCGKKRPPEAKFVYAPLGGEAECPGCGEKIRAEDLNHSLKPKTKKVLVQVLVDPSTGDFFEVRGEVPVVVTAPISGYQFKPKGGPIVSRGKFECEHCGRLEKILDSARTLGRPLSFRYYGYYAHTSHGKKKGTDLYQDALKTGLPTNNFKWFSPAGPEDLAKVDQADASLKKEQSSLPLPNQEIYDGYNTNRLVIHGYQQWADLYNSRQLLCLGRLLKAISEEEDRLLRDALLGAFQIHVDTTSNLASYHISRNMLREVTAAHDYRNPTTTVENNIWGMGEGVGTYINCIGKTRGGYEYALNLDVFSPNGFQKVSDVNIENWTPSCSCQSITNMEIFREAEFDLIVTDPPYAGSVQYAEMSDWYYVWLHQVLKDHYPEFEPEITLKSQEIIENESDKDMDWYFEQLTDAWRECHRVLKDDGLLVFTFHHEKNDRWTGLLTSLFEAGFYLTAAYPVHSEALNSIVIQATKGITYDIIHVCRKRPAQVESITWQSLRRQVVTAAKEKLTELESSGDVLPGPDVWMILLGKALELFSRHYGAVLDSDDEILDLSEGLSRLGLLVRQVRGETLPLPALLRDTDSLTQIYFLHVAGKEGWPRDGLHIELRGYMHSPDDLESSGLVRQTEPGQLEPVPPLERAAEWELSPDPRAPLVDHVHLLLHTLHSGEDPMPLLRAWFKQRDVLSEALKQLGKSDSELKELCDLALRRVADLRPEDDTEPSGQTKMFQDID